MLVPLVFLALASFAIVDSDDCAWHQDDYKCANDKCILKKWVCDGEDDCGDNSDEEDCITTTLEPITITPAGECEDSQFQCKVAEPLTCVHWSWRCDGDKDCPDESDELDCNFTTTTSTPSVSTQAGVSVERGTSSSSISEAVANVCDPEIEFQCVSAPDSCIFLSWLCDGDGDCPDSSDEEGCPGSDTTPAIDDDDDDIENVDDNMDDNDDEDQGDDMGDDSAVITTTTNTVHPFTTASSSSTGFTGFQPSTAFTATTTAASSPTPTSTTTFAVDTTTASDMTTSPITTTTTTSVTTTAASTTPTTTQSVCRYNEFHCVGEVDVTCIAQRFRCDGTINCPSGVDEERCKVNCEDPVGQFGCPDNDTRLLTAVSSEHVRMDHLASGTHTLLTSKSGSSRFVAVDFHYARQLVFSTNIDSYSVERLDMQNNTVLTVMSGPRLEIDDVAVDWVHDNIYWTNLGGKLIGVATLDGSLQTTLHNKTIDKPRGIAVHPGRRFLFWTDWGLGAKIERCGLNGKHRKVIVSTGIVWPNGITIDFTTNQLYWTDARLKRITTSNLDGHNKHVIVSGSRVIRFPFAITVFREYMYWTDWSTDTVRRYNRIHTDMVRKVSDVVVDISQPMGVVVFHSARQPMYENACGTNNGGCAQLCLGDPENSFTCVCSDGFLADPNDHSRCISPDDKFTTGEPNTTTATQTLPTTVTVPTEPSTEKAAFNTTTSSGFTTHANTTPFALSNLTTTQPDMKEATSMSTTVSQTNCSLFYMILMGFRAQSQRDAVRMLEVLKNTAQQVSGNQTFGILQADLNDRK